MVAFTSHMCVRVLYASSGHAFHNAGKLDIIIGVVFPDSNVSEMIRWPLLLHGSAVERSYFRVFSLCSRISFVSNINKIEYGCAAEKIDFRNINTGASELDA